MTTPIERFREFATNLEFGETHGENPRNIYLSNIPNVEKIEAFLLSEISLVLTQAQEAVGKLKEKCTIFEVESKMTIDQALEAIQTIKKLYE